MTKRFKYEIGQKVINKNIGKIIIDNRWQGQSENFYDVMIIETDRMWTYSESQLSHGNIRNPHMKG